MKLNFCMLGLLLSVTAIAFLAGCGSSQPATNATAPGPSPEGAAYRLATEPPGAANVKDAKTNAKSDEKITLVGRIGGDVNPWVEGQAAFLVVDTSLKPCNEKHDDGCKTPWDYCCDAGDLPANKAMVKIVDASGKPLATDARKLLGVKELQTVVVHGIAKRDESGSLTVLADGVFVRN